MLRALLIAMVFALAACSSVPPVPLKAVGQSSFSGFATLALWGEWESELAPAYTRLAAVRHRAARQLDAGKVDVATAISVQQSADRARVLLDDSRRGDTKTPTLLQRAQLAEAQRLIASAEKLLEH